MSVDAILDCFVSGLHSKIRREVVAQNPYSLSKAYALAKSYKEKFDPPTKPNLTKPFHFTTLSSTRNLTQPHKPNQAFHRPKTHPSNVSPWLKCNYAVTKDCATIAMTNFP